MNIKALYNLLTPFIMNMTGVHQCQITLCNEITISVDNSFKEQWPLPKEIGDIEINIVQREIAKPLKNI